MGNGSSTPRYATRLVSVDEAAGRILARVAPLAAVEIPITEALGTTLAEPIRADADVPPFDNSAMDGYAVRAEDVATVPARLRVIERIAAGAAPLRTVGPGQAARIMTGAPIPRGADTIVRIEDTDAGLDIVTVTVATARRTSVRPAGDDIRAGSTVFDPGRVLRPAEIGVLASLGRPRIRVVRRPRVAVVSTGDELVELDAPLGPGQIRDANRYAIAAAVRAAGAEAVDCGVVPDDPEALRQALVAAIASADAIVTSGGVSVGDHDHVKPVVESLGTIEFWSIAIRPGRPLAFGAVGDLRTPIFGLPGNPVSSLLTFELFVRPALLRMAGRTLLRRPRTTARLLETIEKPRGLRFFARGFHDATAGTVRTTGPQGSGILSSMALANCLIDIPEDAAGAVAGADVQVILSELPESE